jgi:hypothetical protein
MHPPLWAENSKFCKNNEEIIKKFKLSKNSDKFDFFPKKNSLFLQNSINMLKTNKI